MTYESGADVEEVARRACLTSAAGRATLGRPAPEEIVMSQSYPPHAHRPADPYAGHPAYAPTPQRSGTNPWVAAGLGVLVGMFVTAVAGALLWFTMGGPVPWEGIEDAAEEWSGRVAVAGDGSVPGPVLADAVQEVGGGGYYEEVVCAATPRVAADVTTLCRVDDGFDRYRLVVLFLDDAGRFETAEFFTPE
ncbi:hypothetical protein [Knoellia aerolata]|uniref:hypothetical protein n=1 Tax=Knoellia aerolata TaxID=442954 RepID=UPI0012ECD8C2|nr:hypothetical protein [Knoellia aerolata]